MNQQDNSGMMLRLHLNIFQQGMKNKQKLTVLLWVQLRMFQQGKLCSLSQR
jgi:hypothetical protein